MREQRWGLSILVGAVLALLLGLCPEGFPSVPVRSFLVTYEVRLPAIPDEARELKVWIPLSRSDEIQRIRRRAIEVPYPYQVTKDPQYGNEILFLDLRQPLPPALELAIHYEVEVREVRPAMEEADRSIPEEVRQRLALHLESNRLMVVDDRVQELARAVTAHADTPVEKARAIYRYVIERMRYEKETPGWGQGDTLRACEVGAGNCTDFHSLFISLARASGIPARFAIGLPVPEKPEGDIPGYHCWAEFYLSKVGWVAVDASEAWKQPLRQEYFFGTHDPNRLAVSLGRDIQLIPKPASSDSVNIFFFPYVELDGKALDREQFQTRFRFRDLRAPFTTSREPRCERQAARSKERRRWRTPWSTSRRSDEGDGRLPPQPEGWAEMRRIASSLVVGGALLRHRLPPRSLRCSHLSPARPREVVKGALNNTGGVHA